MKIVSLHSDPLLEIPFLNAGKGPGDFYVDTLPVTVGEAAGLPRNLHAIVATADLQGRERFEDSPGGPPRLLGEALPARLSREILPELGCQSQRTGAVLAGDFYTLPALEKRGGTGDVTQVWKAFGGEFAWVCGVAGNHDMFGQQFAPSRASQGNMHYLDGTRIALGGLCVAGIGGIIGNPRRPHRRTDLEFQHCLGELLMEPADLLLMHEGPDSQQPQQRGSPRIRQTLNELPPPLVIRGHSHWNQPLAELEGGTQVLNVDCRVVILLNELREKL